MRWLIAGGGTGGHLFPGIALANYVRQHISGAHIHFIGAERGLERTAVPKAGFPVTLLPLAGLRGRAWSAQLATMGDLPKALWQALQLIDSFRPDVAVGVGGYAASAGIVAAWLRGVPCYLLEQNAVPGMTNRWLARLARHVFLNLPSNSFPAHKCSVVGNPIRQEIAAIGALPYTIPAKPSLLILGGSQGARALNQLMPTVWQLITKQQPNCHWLHQTGNLHAKAVQAAYQQVGATAAQVTVVPFVEDMAQAYQQATLLICRAGASTLAELTCAGRPSVLVPFPAATDNHQQANGAVLVAAGAARMQLEATMSAEQMGQTILDLLQNNGALQAMAAAAKQLGRADAVERIVHHIQQEVPSVS